MWIRWKRHCFERLGHRMVPHPAYSQQITFAADQPGPDRDMKSQFCGFLNKKNLGELKLNSESVKLPNRRD
jgi:hypothetical protein